MHQAARPPGWVRRKAWVWDQWAGAQWRQAAAAAAAGAVAAEAAAGPALISPYEALAVAPRQLRLPRPPPQHCSRGSKSRASSARCLHILRLLFVAAALARQSIRTCPHVDAWEMQPTHILASSLGQYYPRISLGHPAWDSAVYTHFGIHPWIVQSTHTLASSLGRCGLHTIWHPA